MIESVRIDDEGPDGTYLVLVGDGFGFLTDRDNPRQVIGQRGQISDDALRELDAALQPFRDHWAQGEQVRRWYREHRGAGFCTGWVPGGGPCQREYGHEGDHAPEGIGAP